MNKRRSNTRQELCLCLDDKLSAIGMMISSRALTKKEIATVDIELTLVEAFYDLGKVQNTLRILAPLLTWIEEHGSTVIIEKLTKILFLYQAQGKDISIAALFGKFAMLQGHKRWLALSKKFTLNPEHPRPIGPADMSISLLSLRGEEEWAIGSGFSIPKGLGKTNKKWILSKKALAKINHQYRNRLIYGSQWRSDIITAYEQGATNPTEASQITGASYEPCHRVKKELEAAGVLAS